MTWTKLGDEYADECWTLSDAAFRLHTEALVWSNRKQTDGRLAKDDMLRWAKHPAAAQQLVAIGWWEDHTDHFQIIHHIGYQRKAEQVARQSIANRSNRAKGTARPVQQDDSSNQSSNKSSNKSSDESSTGDESSDERDRTGQA